MDKIAGKDLSILISHRCAVIPAHSLVMAELTLDSGQVLSIALPPDQAETLVESLKTALARLRSIQ